MNAVNVGTWNANWAWSLPLIVLNVVIHVIGLALIYERVVHVLSGAMERRRFIPKFVVVIGIAALSAAVLHSIEAAIWAPPTGFSAPYQTPGLRCSIRSAQ